jgi:hypothetical protein
VIRSFVAWGLIKDLEKSGFYEKTKDVIVLENDKLLSLFIEASLYATPEKRLSLQSLSKDPAFFPFTLLNINSSKIIKNNNRIAVESFSMNDEYVILKR